MHRSNLVIFENTLVERVLLQGHRAVGVSAQLQGKLTDLKAEQEVILCGGAINSPQLLMLSGIGRASELEAHGLTVHHALDGVGENLQDHPTVSLAMENPSAESYALSWRAAHKVIMAPLRYALGHRGMLASNAAEAGGFIRSMEGLSRPDVQYTFMVGLKDNPRTLPRRHGYFLHMAVLRPRTSGKISLRTSNPLDKPNLQPNFLEDAADVQTLIRAMREARRIVNMPALKKLSGLELSPGPGVTDDMALESFIRERVATTYHPVGTCKMGPSHDPMAVVNAQLQVHGIAGLRVADASIMPRVPGGNTSAPSMMIGERAAQFILHP
jgi:choline dehydrogenase-like flavoprotein